MLRVHFMAELACCGMCTQSSLTSAGPKTHKRQHTLHTLATQQIAIDLPKPHTPATVSEWAEELLPDFIKKERELRLAAEKVAAEKEAKRLAERNKSKVCSVESV